MRSDSIKKNDSLHCLESRAKSHKFDLNAAHSRSPIEAGRLPLAQNLVKIGRSLNRLLRKNSPFSSFQLPTDATKLAWHTVPREYLHSKKITVTIRAYPSKSKNLQHYKCSQVINIQEKMKSLIMRK